MIPACCAATWPHHFWGHQDMMETQGWQKCLVTSYSWNSILLLRIQNDQVNEGVLRSWLIMNLLKQIMPGMVHSLLPTTG